MTPSFYRKQLTTPWRIFQKKKSRYQSLSPLHYKVPTPYLISDPFTRPKISFINQGGNYCSFISTSTTTSHVDKQSDYILRFCSHVHKNEKSAGVGIAIYNSSNDSLLWSGYHFIQIAAPNNCGNLSVYSHLADYMALDDGLQIIKTLVKRTESNSSLISSHNVEVQTNNELLASHLKKERQAQSKKLKPLYKKVFNMINNDFGRVTIHGLDNKAHTDLNRSSERALKEQKSSESYLKIMKQETPEISSNAISLKKNIVKKEQSVHSMESDLSELPSITGNDEAYPQSESSEKENLMADNQSVEQDSEANNITTNSLEEDLHELKKSAVVSVVVKFPKKKYVLCFDGGYHNQTRSAGLGMVLYDSDNESEIWSGCRYLKYQISSSQAEYMALITGLQCAKSMKVKTLVVQGDNLVVLRQIEGKYAVKCHLLKYYYNEAMKLKQYFSSFKINIVNRSLNSRADELANEALNKKKNRGLALVDSASKDM